MFRTPLNRDNAGSEGTAPRLCPPCTFSTTADAASLIPPSHFTTPATPKEPATKFDSFLQEVLHLRQENGRLKEALLWTTAAPLGLPGQSRLEGAQEMRLPHEERGRIRSEERERVRREERVRSEERERVRSEERVRGEERHRIYGEELDRVRREERERVRSEEREKVRSEERDRIYGEELERVRREERERIRSEERDRIYGEELERVRSEERERVRSEERDRIYGEELERVRSEEREKVRSDERDRIYDEEMERVRSEEREKVRSDERDRIYGEELERVRSEEREKVRSEERDRIYGEELERVRGEERERIRAEEREGALRGEREEERELSRLGSLLRETERREEQLQQELGQCRSDAASQAQLVQQMRRYVGTRAQHEEEEEGPDRDSLLARVQVLEKENSRLRAESELQCLRLSSLSHILTTQEAIIHPPAAKGDDLNAGGDGDGLQPPPPLLLLSCWRQKAYALLVQLSCQEAQQRKEARERQTELLDLQQVLRRNEGQVKILELGLSDRTAELKLQTIRAQGLQEDLDALRAAAQEAQQRAARAEAAVHRLQETVSRRWREVTDSEGKVVGAMESLGRLSERVRFATRRVDLVRGLVLRRDALHRLALQEQPTIAPSPDVTARPDLQAELSHLQAERDLLSSQMQRDALLMQEKISLATHRAEEACAEQLQRLWSLAEERSALHEETQARLQQAQHELQQAQHELEAARTQQQQQLEQLQQELQQEHGAKDQAVRAVERDLRARYADQLSGLEQSLNQARREHGKAVVALRQGEREWSRERERARELTQTRDRHHHEQLQQLQSHLQQLQADGSLMKATLRQEGLLQQYKARRVGGQQLEKGQRHTGSLSSVLKDLKALSVEVLTEDAEEGGRPDG